MTTTAHAIQHFTTLVDAEVERTLERATAQTAAMYSRAMQTHGNGSRAYPLIGEYFANQIREIREYVIHSTNRHLKPYIDHADKDERAAIQAGILRAFDDAMARFDAATQRYAPQPGRLYSAASQPALNVKATLVNAMKLERSTLEAELALAVPPPSGPRHSAVLATDIVGYSSRMASDEAATLADRSDCLATVKQAVAANRGRFVKSIGDGTLSEFKSTVDAMRAALEIQIAIAEQNKGKSAEGHVEMRIGLAVGDVVDEDNDILGNTVNLAARLEGQAAPGTVYAPEHVRNDLMNKQVPPFSSDELGPLELKGMGSVRVVRIRPA